MCTRKLERPIKINGRLFLKQEAYEYIISIVAAKQLVTRAKANALIGSLIGKGILSDKIESLYQYNRALEAISSTEDLDSLEYYAYRRALNDIEGFLEPITDL